MLNLLLLKSKAAIVDGREPDGISEIWLNDKSKYPKPVRLDRDVGTEDSWLFARLSLAREGGKEPAVESDMLLLLKLISISFVMLEKFKILVRPTERRYKCER